MNTENAFNLIDNAIVLSKMLNVVPCHIFWKDKNLNFRGCNYLFAQQFGYDHADKIIGKTDDDFPWSDNELKKKYHNDDLYVISTGNSMINMQEDQIQTDGSIKTLLVSKVPLKDEQENVVGILGSYVDISYIKATEKSLIDSKNAAESANRTKTEFLANLSHDVVTPLLSINILANNLLENHDEKSKESAELILSCQQQLSTFFKNCLDNANFELESPQLLEESFSLPAFFQEIYNLFIANATQKKIFLNIHINDSANMTVLGCRFILLRIVLNLVNNAVKFTENGGITIEVNASTSSHKNEILLTISVQDTGIGIPEDKQACIFERLTRLAPAFSKRIEGSGIGLHIVDQYAKRINGEIHLKSEVGVGSTFTVTLPLKIASNDAKKR